MSFNELKEAIFGDNFWEAYLQNFWSGRHEFSVHLAVFVEPYLSYILEGRKTVESRFSVVRCAPYRRVSRGDVVLLKLSGGPVVGLCRVGQVWSYQLDPHSWQTIRKEFAEVLCAQDPEFWQARKKASFATLMKIENVHQLTPIPWAKRDRRGWVVLRVGYEATLFEDLMTNTVLAFVGGIASGKSTLSSGVAEALGCPRVSFGEYVRKVTRLRGLEDNRENLQSVGESLLLENPEQFCEAVLAEAPWESGSPLVVDGIRHEQIAKILKKLVSPSGLQLIYIDVDDKIRDFRHQQKAPHEKSLKILEQHSTEIQVRASLRQLANKVVDGNRPPNELVREISSWAKQQLP